MGGSSGADRVALTVPDRCPAAMVTEPASGRGKALVYHGPTPSVDALA